MTQELYILCHKKIDYDIDLSKYIPIQVGAELSSENLYDIKDNIKDNISFKNDYYLETTGIYWIWKNSTADIKGQMQFRRFLSVNPIFINSILNEYDIILANPLYLYNISVEQQYYMNHNILNLLQIKQILKEFYPSYFDSYNKYISEGNYLYYSNSFIAKKEVYDEMCNFIFTVLDIFEKRYNISNKNERYKYAQETLSSYENNPQIKEIYDKSHPELSYLEYQT